MTGIPACDLVHADLIEHAGAILTFSRVAENDAGGLFHHRAASCRLF